MNKGNLLRIALIDLDVSNSIDGSNIWRLSNIREIKDMLCLLSTADINRVFCVCCALLDNPVDHAIDVHAQEKFKTEMAEMMAELQLPEPVGSISVLTQSDAFRKAFGI